MSDLCLTCQKCGAKTDQTWSGRCVSCYRAEFGDLLHVSTTGQLSGALAAAVEDGKAQERAAIVAWLRLWIPQGKSAATSLGRAYANAIEACDHLKDRT